MVAVLIAAIIAPELVGGDVPITQRVLAGGEVEVQFLSLREESAGIRVRRIRESQNQRQALRTITGRSR
jgi:hypothetical protein